MLKPSGERIVIRPEGYEEAEVSPDAEEDEKSEKDDRYPKITEEDWIARERARKLLRNILSRQAEACEAQRKALLKESLAGPSPYELAAEIASSPADALQTRRLQDANLLLRIQSRERKTDAPGSAGDDLVCQDVPENKEG